MAIHNVLKGRAFAPEQVQVVSDVYERVLQALNVPPGTGRRNEEIAAFVIEFASVEMAATNAVNADRIYERVIKILAPSKLTRPNSALDTNGRAEALWKALFR